MWVGHADDKTKGTREDVVHEEEGGVYEVLDDECLGSLEFEVPGVLG